MLPERVSQGQVLKVLSHASGQARLQERMIRLFPQADGSFLGLMPVNALTKPGTYTLEWLDDHAQPVHRTDVAVTNAHFAKQNIVLTKALSGLHSTSDEREIVSAFLRETSETRYWKEPLVAPLPGCITSPFGVMRLHNGRPTGDYHAGLDQRGPFGSPIHAVSDGVVKISRKFVLRGGTVAIDHGQGFESIYLHMSGFAAKEGDHVAAGDVIGYVGSSGRSTGPHLHWTLYANGEPVSPMQWISGLKACPAPKAPASVKRPRRRAPAA